jgi:DNA-binding NarL/FixJ family response regulator
VHYIKKKAEKHPKMSSNPRVTLTVNQQKQVIDLLNGGKSQTAIAKQFGCNQGTISRIRGESAQKS